MRKLLKIFELENTKYVFDGNSLELFKVTDINDVIEYTKQKDEFVSEKQIVENESISKIVLNTSNKCNLRCKYCYADGGKYASQKDEIMSINTLENIVTQLLGENIKYIGIVSFFGGEPLINYSLIKRGIELFDNSFEVQNYEIVTNGWYLNEEILMFLKEHNVKLSISIDGPQSVTDFLRGKGTYNKVIQGLNIAKNIGYRNIECSATYTKYHEDQGYSYQDINDYFNSLGVKATISRVISKNMEIVPTNKPTKEELKRDIYESASKIYNNQQVGGVNPYLYRTLLSLAFGARSISYCDDLMGDFSITYDYDGEKYNCFHFWGDKKYVVKNEEICNERIQKINCKESNEICASCWAKYLCKICIASIMQNTMEWPMLNNGECRDRNVIEMCMECIIRYHMEGKLAHLMENFANNFVTYQ